MGDRLWDTGLRDLVSQRHMDVPIRSFHSNVLLLFSSNECLNSKLSASSRSQSKWPRDASIEGKAEEQRCHLLQLPPSSSQPPAPLPQLCPIGCPAQGELPWCGFKASARGLCRQRGLAGSTHSVGTGLLATRFTSLLWDGDRGLQAPTLDVPVATPLHRLHQEE